MKIMNFTGESLLKSALEALEYAKSQTKGSKTHKVIVPKDIDVKAIRNNCHTTREEFSKRNTKKTK